MDTVLETVEPIFRDLSPAIVWRHFAVLCAIPRPSKKESRLARHLVDWAKMRGLSAELDGAGAWNRFRHVTWPLLRPTSVAVSMLLAFNAFQAFDEFYNTLSTASGYPPYARPPLVYLYLVTFGSGSQDLGIGSAGTMIVTLVILVFSFLQNRLLGIGARR